MPRLSTVKQDIPSADGQVSKWLEPGQYVCVITSFSDLIKKEWEGTETWWYHVCLEEVVPGDQQGACTIFKIQSNESGTIPKNKKGQGRWDMLLDAVGEDRTIEDYDTDQLLYRAVSVTLIKPEGFKLPFIPDPPNCGLNQCGPDAEEAALEYVGKWYPVR